MPVTPRIYRLRRTAGVGGGRVFVAQADVYGYSETFTLLAAHEGRVRHWQNIATLDITSVKVKPRYQFMGEVTAHEANDPHFPILIRYERYGQRANKTHPRIQNLARRKDK